MAEAGGGLAAASFSIALSVLLRFRLSEVHAYSPKELARNRDKCQEHYYLYLRRQYEDGTEAGFRPWTVSLMRPCFVVLQNV